MANHAAQPIRESGFGTFKGVYTPSLLTILGVIMYLRFGWVLGNAGLTETLIIVTLASSITFLTGLSIAATATNMRVGGGGAYFMISRSLGLESGAAIGLPLFFAQALVISFYTTGFAESVHELFPILPTKAAGVATLVLLTALAYLSSDLALKAQFFILAAIALSLISLFAGGAPVDGWAPIDPQQIPEKSGFWVVFAVFFPAVTGIEAGIALSGNLKDPSKSLPMGTLGAVLTGYAVYMLIPIFMARIVPEQVLLTDNLVMRKVAWWGDAIVLGVWGATLSSALSSLLGAPRTLQALARDNVVPRFLGRGTGAGDEPRIATAVAFGLALAGVLAGDLDAIAPVLSMFFLTSYGVLNLSAGLEGLIGSPSWRPAFRTPWYLSLLGALGCLFTMLMINPGATFIASFLCLAVFYLMERRQLRARWGDMRYGLYMLLARFAIYRMAESHPDEKTWRPNILALSGSPTSRWYLIELAHAITHGRGFMSVAAIVPESWGGGDQIEQTRTTIRHYLQKHGVQALVKIQPADDVLVGARQLITTYGIGPVVPNTILLGETERPESFLEFARLMRLVYQRKRNLVVVREGRSGPVFGKGRRIDVWWGGQKKNAGLMLALGYMLETSPGWTDASLTLKTIVQSEAEKEAASKSLSELVEQGRVRAETEVLVRSQEKDVFQIIQQSSRESQLVLLGIRPPQKDESLEEYGGYYADLIERTQDLPPTAFVLANESIDFTRIFE